MDNCGEIGIRAIRMAAKKNNTGGSSNKRGGKGTEKTLRQIRVPLSVRGAVEQYASDHNELILETQNKAIMWFLEQKRKKTISVLYYMASGLEPTWSMWIYSSVLRDLQALSKKEDIPENRIMFTALVTFLKSEGYLEADY